MKKLTEDWSSPIVECQRWWIRIPSGVLVFPYILVVFLIVAAYECIKIVFESVFMAFSTLFEIIDGQEKVNQSV